jgi:hypothetical protein
MVLLRNEATAQQSRVQVIRFATVHKRRRRRLGWIRVLCVVVVWLSAIATTTVVTSFTNTGSSLFPCHNGFIYSGVVVHTRSAVVLSSSQLEVNNEHNLLLPEPAQLPPQLSLYGTKRRRFRNMIPGTRYFSPTTDSDNVATKSNNATTTTDIDRSSLDNVVNSRDRLALDRLILATAVPSMINMAVVPLVNAVDTFWVGRMGSALALAGQAAANHAFFTVYFLVSYLPTITAPRVAAAVGSGQLDVAQTRVSESLFLSNLLGGLGTVLLVAYPMAILSFILPAGTPAIAYAVPYLRYRGLSMMPALMASTGFAAYRGLLDTVTPLKVSLCTK